MSVPPHTVFGASNFRLEPDKLQRRPREIHTLEGRWQTSSETYFALQSPPPGYSNMRIVEIDPTTEIPDAQYDLKIKAEGIRDSSTFIELDQFFQETEEGWDEGTQEIFTASPTSARWARGARLQADDLLNVAATASADLLTKVDHGMQTGQCFSIAFASGYGGLTTGSSYYAIVISSSTLKAATTKANALAGTAINITSDGTAATVTPFLYEKEFLFITARVDHPHRARDFHVLTLQLKGLIGSKPWKRRISTSAQTVSTKVTGALSLTADKYIGYPPVDTGTDASLTGTDLELEYDLPGVSITDTLVTTTAPPTDLIGQFWSPTDPPSTGGFTIFADAYRYHVPFGWKCTNLQSEQIPGQQIWLVSVTWAYQRGSSPLLPP